MSVPLGTFAVKYVKYIFSSDYYMIFFSTEIEQLATEHLTSQSSMSSAPLGFSKTDYVILSQYYCLTQPPLRVVVGGGGMKERVLCYLP